MKTRSHLAAPLLALSLATATAVWAQTIGEPPEQLGKVSFANSCAPAVQPTFERGVALMHSFWFQESERTFREVLERDPKCAIATWAIATMLMGNPFGVGPPPQRLKRAQEAIERGRAIGAKTERERFYIEAIGEYYERFGDRPHGARMKSLANAFEVVAKRFPDDDEAQIFYALYLIASQEKTDKTLAVTLKGAGILESQFVKHSEHPGVAHYLIHSYDYPPIAEKGLKAAKSYVEIAPSVAHGLHMPSHIFTLVGAWKESVATNRRAAAVAKAGKDPDQELHAMEYMVYAYMQLARDKDASLVVEDAQRVTGADLYRQSAAVALATIPARYAIERGMWKDAARLKLHQSKVLYADAMTYFARALGAARSGDTAAAGKEVQELARIVNALKAAKDDRWANEVEVQRLGAAAWTAYATGKRDEALTLMRSAADIEDKGEALGPGRVQPARELLGEMLLEIGRPVEALAEFERLQVQESNRFRSLYGAGQAAAQSGNRDKARYYFSRLIEMAGSGDLRPEMEKARRYLASN
jgi:tetratricopeptide (TPR) repeat protein